MSVSAATEHSGRTQRNWPKKAAILLIVILVVVALVGVCVSVSKWTTKRHNDDLASKKHSLIVQAAAQLAPQNVKKLKPLTLQIKQQPNYNNDQSYVYILLIYDINLSDAQAANSNLQQLKKIYKGDAAYDSGLTQHALSQTQLINIVEYLQKQASSGNVMTFGGSAQR